MSLVTSDWLENNLNDVKIIDCSWHMPGIDRNPEEEYSKNHIPGAIFFDLDKNSNQDTDLPHMLPTKEKWEEIVSSMGISNTDRIIIYDNSDVLSSCRGWYNFIYFGHLWAVICCCFFCLLFIPCHCCCIFYNYLAETF